MFLAFDIGNSKIKTGLFEDGELMRVDVFVSLNDLATELPAAKIKGAAISSVVPGSTLKLKEIIKNHYGFRPFVITKDSLFNLKINYGTPETLGIDRLCSAEGAFAEYKKSLTSNSYGRGVFIISIDFGTATTVNIIEYPGVFIGGVIAPGIKTMINALTSATAQLPAVDGKDYKGIIGKDTKSSIASGIINSAAGLIERTFTHVKTELKAAEIISFITGGNAEIIMNHLNFAYRFEKALVLKGIKSVYDINSKN